LSRAGCFPGCTVATTPFGELVHAASLPNGADRREILDGLRCRNGELDISLPRDVPKRPSRRADGRSADP